MSSDIAQLDFTVAICTYNGATRIPEVLDCLRRQVDVQQLRWEVLVVDNNSTDNTSDVICRYQQTWTHAYPLRYAFESQQGAGYARQKAIRLARSPWIGFLDDDNLPAADWVYQAYQFAQAHPHVGVVGSRIRGAFEVSPPPNFERIAPFLALTDRGDQPRYYVPEQKVLPPSAGMVVQRDVWLQHVPDRLVLNGRTHTSMLTGEDLEVILHIQRAGWQVWYNPAMQLEHKIPAHRLTRSYLLKLMRGIGLSRHRTRMLSVPLWQRPAMFLAYGLNDIRKIVTHVLKHGPRVWTDPVTASELTLYCYSFVSPYFLWFLQLRRVWSHAILPSSTFVNLPHSEHFSE